jgi:predicted RNA-binding protein with RPS1 domain
MIFILPNPEELTSESDIEQKLVYPLLTAEHPSGLGLDQATILTKASIRRFPIGKGNDRKLYYPDYLVLIGGFPLIVVEVKAPGEGTDEAFREARLYSTELNALYPSGLNPLTKVLVTDGVKIVAGRWDHAVPSVEMDISALSPSNQKMAELSDLLGVARLRKDFARIGADINPKKYWKPRRLLGGEAIQQGEVGHNTFGSTVAADFAHIFNPATEDDRIKIATKGYVPSKRRERYVYPIDRVIRASRPKFESEATLVEDTSAPREILRKLKDQKPLEHQVLLLIGSPGSGKSTFVDHLQYAALPKDIADSTVWVRLNMNNAPSVQAEIYDWLRMEIINGCRMAYHDIDFDELPRLKNVFSVEVRRWAVGVGRLYTADQKIYDIKLAEFIETLLRDRHKQATAYARHCATERGKLLMLVLDNCDKRNRDQQLLMFEAAQWIQKEFRALVILPLREETYDNHRDEPPLDTALKDLVFRIDPPLFHSVLVSRVQLALNELTSSSTKMNSYELPNGFHVKYPDSDKAYYLSAIMNAVFHYDRQIRRIIVGLSASNIRRALEIFLEFCRSGHIAEDQIFRIRQSEGKHVLPLSLVVRVLLRMNRRYYDSDPSYVKNLFTLYHRDVRPSYFVRLIILRWLSLRFSQQGPSQLKGYFRIAELIKEMSLFGTEATVVLREMEYLAKAQCVITEDFRTDRLTQDDLVRLGPAGFVHLELLENADYLAAVAEDTWFDDENSAKRVAERIKQLEKQFDIGNTIANAREVLTALESARKRDLSAVLSIVENSTFENLTDLSAIKRGLDVYEISLTARPWQTVPQKYHIDVELVGTVTNVREFGVFVELEPGVTGLIPASRLPPHFDKMEDFDPGEKIIVKPMNIDPIRARMGLRFVRSAEKHTDLPFGPEQKSVGSVSI